MVRTFDEVYLPNYDSYEDIRLFEVGCQKCPPSYGYGPIIRDTYLIHYILEGCGTLFAGGMEHRVCGKQAFLTYPGELNRYRAGEDTPWNYIWIRFHGAKVPEMLRDAGFSKEQPVFVPAVSCPELEQCFFELLHNNEKEYASIGNLYRMFQLMSDVASNKPAREQKTNAAQEYTKTAVNYITEKYSEPIRIREIADYCGLDRSYLCKIFKKETGYTPVEYLIRYRMRKAKQLLRQTSLPVRYIAFSVGYSDPFAFSKVFKKESGMSPTVYRSTVNGADGR